MGSYPLEPLFDVRGGQAAIRPFSDTHALDRPSGLSRFRSRKSIGFVHHKPDLFDKCSVVSGNTEAMAWSVGAEYCEMPFDHDAVECHT